MTMSPIRNHVTHKQWLILFWAVVAIAVVVSTGALRAAHSAGQTAQRSEKGFCIAIQLIESGALADATVALNNKTQADIAKVRLGQARGSIHFASQLRSIVHCPPPEPRVKKLYVRFNINQKVSENR
jgi:hypothetical protein